MLGIGSLKWPGTVFTEFDIMDIQLKKMRGGIGKLRKQDTRISRGNRIPGHLHVTSVIQARR